MVVQSINLFSITIFLISYCLKVGFSIVNPAQNTTNIVIYMRPINELGPQNWRAGVDCLDKFTRVYFQRRDKLTRSYNMIVTSILNMSTPAAQIQEGFLKQINEAVSNKKRAVQDLFQLRVISNSQPFVRVPRWERHGFLIADYYVIVIDSVDALRIIMQDYISRSQSWNAGARFLILYNNVSDHHTETETAAEIFNELRLNFYVHGIALLYATAALNYSFLVMDYFNNRPCRTMRVRRITTCNYSKKEADDKDLKSAKKIMNAYFTSSSIKNCTFYMCASIQAPFVEDDCVSGIELRIINFIKNRLGFSIKQSCKNESRGVKEKYSDLWTGLLGKLNKRSCDFVLGGIYPDNEVLQSFWTTECYLSDSHTWFVKLADIRPPWIALYSIFENNTWSLLLLILLLTWLLWYSLWNLLPEPAKTAEFSLSGINNMAVSLCVAISKQPLYNATRIFFMALNLYGMNIVAIYTSKLIAVFSNPGFLHQIENLKEVVEANIPFGGSEENSDWFENESDMWIYENFNDSSAFDSTYENLLAVKNGERVILSSRMYILQNPISDYIFAFPQNVFSSPLQMIMKPGFPFVKNFDWVIRYMHDGGFFAKIDNDFIYNNTYLNRISKMRPDFNEATIVLTTDHLQGPFAILVIGVLSSIICLTIEIIHFWYLAPYLNRLYGWNLDTHNIRKIKRKRLQKEQRKADKLKSNNFYDIEKQPIAIDIKLKKRPIRKISPNCRDIYKTNEIPTIRFTPTMRRKIKKK